MKLSEIFNHKKRKYEKYNPLFADVIDEYYNEGLSKALNEITPKVAIDFHNYMVKSGKMYNSATIEQYFQEFLNQYKP